MSNINPYCQQRISDSQISGASLLQTYYALQQQLESLGAPSATLVFQFVENPLELKPGDLVPEICLTLRRYVGPIMAEQGDILPEGE